MNFQFQGAHYHRYFLAFPIFAKENSSLFDCQFPILFRFHFISVSLVLSQFWKFAVYLYSVLCHQVDHRRFLPLFLLNF